MPVMRNTGSRIHLTLTFSLQPGILDTLAEEESNSEDEDDLVDIDLVALEAAA